MLSLEQRLDKAEEVIRKPSFRQNKGLGNEVGYYIFDYPAEQELAVRERVEYIRQKNEESIDGFRVVVFDLYDIVISILKDKGYLEKNLLIVCKALVHFVLRIVVPDILDKICRIKAAPDRSNEVGLGFENWRRRRDNENRHTKILNVSIGGFLICSRKATDTWQIDNDKSCFQQGIVSIQNDVTYLLLVSRVVIVVHKFTQICLGPYNDFGLVPREVNNSVRLTTEPNFHRNTGGFVRLARKKVLSQNCIDYGAFSHSLRAEERNNHIGGIALTLDIEN